MSEEAPLPRYFWRRLFATLVDYTLASMVFLLVLLPFHDPDTNGLRLSGVFTVSTCKKVTSLGQEHLDLVAPSTVSRAQVCEVKPFGIYNGRSLTLVFDETESRKNGMRTRSAKNLTVNIDPQGKVVQTVAPQELLALFLLVIGGAALVARGRQTPGKALLGIKVTGTGCALCRELRRWGPLMVLALLSMLATFIPAKQLTGLLGFGLFNLVVPLLLLFGFLVWYYVWPLLRWTGAMRYDRATGFAVTRAR